MGGSPSTASGGDWSAPNSALGDLQSTYIQGATSRAMQPYLYNLDPSQLQAMGTNLATSNAVNSMGLEGELTPQTAAMRQALPNQLNQALQGNDPLAPMLEKYATTAGLQQSLDSGLGTNSSLGQAQIMNVLGQGVMNRYNQNQSNAANWLQGNPLPTTGLDPGSLVSMYAQNQGNIANAYNQGLSTAGGLQGGSVQNAFGQLQQNQQRAAGIASNNANSANQYAGAEMGMAGQLGGAAIGGASSMMAFSSEKVKENIKDFEGGYDLIKNLKVKTYDYKKGYGKKDCIGLIAEETPEPMRVIPEDGGIEMVDVYSTLGAAISAIQTLQKKIEVLEGNLVPN